ncbi:ABC transporter substrate-binding protein [Sutcliffiella horikoshii]|uniref:ABC transporter substrate-binding protein n=1 Tax=Sutcliffiella horikoshii TaxID=79883 RepID=UPI001CBB3768|nr:ABC transporter substrate-binding protein [Sutcliffiella horikoshii]UAL48258.1 SgrR family transcriptional regulator [Sutcliffiella horikoshii]
MNDRYITLRANLHHYKGNHCYEVKLEDLDGIWFCTRKNSKRILKKLERAGQLKYQPGRGRGNASQITYPIEFQQEMDTYIEECVNRGDLESIAQVLRVPIPEQWVMNFSLEIRQLLGLKRDETVSRDVLHTFRARDITTLDPLRVSVSLETHLIEYLGDTLVRYNREDDCFDPHIAHHFDVANNNRIWTFYLRKAVAFHHGGIVTSRDIAHTINRMKNSQHSYSWLARNITKIKCSHPYKVEIHLAEPNPFFLRYLSAPHFCILPEDIEFNEYQWIGTGPFRLKERTEHKLVLMANDVYFKERPLIDEIHFYKVTHEAAKIVYLSNKEEVDKIEPRKHKIKDAGIRLLSFNLLRSNVVKQHSFREAIYHIFNVRKMAKELEWEVLEARSFEIEKAGPQLRDLSKIPYLLKISGYKGEALNLYHFVNQHAVVEAEWLKKEASKYEILLNLHPITFQEFTENGTEHDIDLLIMGLSLSFDKHLAFSYAFRNKALLFNRLFDRKIDRYIQEMLTAFELTEERTRRDEIMEEMEQYLQKEHAIIFLYHPIVTRALDPIIQDVESNSFGHLDFRKLWVRS